jgi:hypothetical protein
MLISSKLVSIGRRDQTESEKQYLKRVLAISRRAMHAAMLCGYRL